MSTALRLLIIENSDQEAAWIKWHLESGGFDVTLRRAASAEEIETIRLDRMDLAIVQYRESGFGGIEALRLIQKKQENSLPVIFLSDVSGEEIAVEALKAGAADYLLRSSLPRLAAVATRVLHEAGERWMQRQAERVQGAIYRIAESASKTENLDQLFRSIHVVIGELMPADNFFIALYDPSSNLLSFPYYKDQFDETPAPYPLGKGLTEYVLRTGMPLLAPQTRYEQMIALREIEAVGTPAVDWLGVPLRVKEQNIGVLVVQSYTPGVRFGATEVNILTFVSSQIAMAIFQKQAEVTLRHQLRRQAALRVVDTAIATNFDLHETLNILIEQLRSLLHVDAAAVLVLEDGIGRLRYQAGAGFFTPVAERTQWDIEQGCAGYIARQREKVMISDLQRVTGSRRLAILAGEGFVGYIGIPLIARGQVKGVLEVFHRTPLTPNREWMDYLETLAGQAAIAIDNGQLFENLQRSNRELAAAYDATIEGWARALELRDQETEGHSERVKSMTDVLATAMGIEAEIRTHMRRGALLHDIGKMAIPDEILLKHGPLTAEEWEIMRKHPLYAYEMLYPVKYLRPALEIPYCHHEKFDGSGYPQGLKGERIPISSRIFAVIDVWDALTNARPYRPAWSEEKSLQYILEQSGRHFDPHVVEYFVKVSPWKAVNAIQNQPPTMRNVPGSQDSSRARPTSKDNGDLYLPLSKATESDII